MGRTRITALTVALIGLWAACGDGRTGIPAGDAGPGMVSVGGTVQGLTGGGLVLRNNGGDDLAVSADGSFTFARTIAAGTAYAVTVASQPTMPSQTCTVLNASGTAGVNAVRDLIISCVNDSFLVGGTVTGLAGTGLVLENNVADEVAVAVDGAFTFAANYPSETAFSVTVKTQPTAPTQTCNVGGGTGTIGNANVTTVVVDCATDRFTISGVASGLAGTAVLQNNGGDDIDVTANGSFAFPASLASGESYEVTVRAQPTAPSQSCVITAGSGEVTTADITSVRLDCTTHTFTVGGTASGLAGDGLVLQNRGGDNLVVTADGTFTFATPVASGEPYAVTVLTQPTDPTQQCTVTNGSGTMGGAAISDVVVTCETSAFTVGGAVTGLAGSGLTLQNRGGNDLVITADGTFTFTAAVDSGEPYAVTILTQPTNPSQTCSVSGGTGTVGASPVTSVTVDCSVDELTVGGTISGLAGTVVLQNNARDTLPLTANGTFAFPSTVSSGQPYAVTVLSQPGTPSQTCVVANGTGTVTASDITSVTVTCTTNRYRIRGTVTGLDGTGLALRNNGGDTLSLGANGAFVFATSVASGGTYSVTVFTANKSQTCAVGNGSGTVTTADVTNVAVTCTTNEYRIGGTVSGLDGTGLVLKMGAESLSVGANGTFAFTTRVASGGTYAVTVTGQPSQRTQTCAVTAGSGTVTNAEITSVRVTCTTTTYPIGGTVSGLAGTGLVLRNNGGNDLPIPADGSFTFTQRIASGDAFAVTIATQPSSPTQSCTLSGETGTVGASAVTSVAVNCITNTYTIGGTITGLGGTVTLHNGADSIPVSSNGSFAFPTAVASGQPYAVTVGAQPTGPSQTCTVTSGSGSGTVGDSDVTSVAITCETNRYTIGGAISGLGGTLVLRNNGADELTRTTNGSFTFATPIPSGTAYAVTILSAPASQQCTVTNGAGTATTAHVTSVAVTCVERPTLTVAKVGAGTVSSSPAGIDCGADCTETYTAGTTVTLTATGIGGNSFIGWSGGGCVGDGSCVVTLNASTTVTARFGPLLLDPAPSPTYFESQRCDGGISLAMIAHTSTTITALDAWLDPTEATRVKFAIFNRSTRALLYASEPVPVAGVDLQFVSSPPMSFSLVAGTHYHIVALIEGCATIPWDTTPGTVNGLQTLSRNGNPTDFAAPMYDGSEAGVDPRIRIYGTQP